LSRECARSLQLEGENRKITDTQKLYSEIEKQRDNLGHNLKEEREKRDTAEKKLNETSKKYDDLKRHFYDIKNKY
jgi:predicted  nucleic acid-binding Zn-ribbon protein